MFMTPKGNKTLHGKNVYRTIVHSVTNSEPFSEDKSDCPTVRPDNAHLLSARFYDVT